MDLKIHAEARKAVLILKKVFEMRMESGALLDLTIRFLRRIEHDPTVTFAAWFL